VQTPRVFVSAKNMLGLPELRHKLSSIVSATARADNASPDGPENDGVVV
jgi:hypothetical protein